jgi:curved DNA-binding protein CbpA
MNYYLILGIPADADEETIRHAFRVLARQYHPDAGSGSSAEKFRQVFEAYETLRDPARRALYDNSLQARRGSVRPFTIEPLRPEPTRAEPIRPDFSFRSDIIEQLFDELFRDFCDDAFPRRPFPRW